MTSPDHSVLVSITQPGNRMSHHTWRLVHLLDRHLLLQIRRQSPLPAIHLLQSALLVRKTSRKQGKKLEDWLGKGRCRPFRISFSPAHRKVILLEMSTGKGMPLTHKLARASETAKGIEQFPHRLYTIQTNIRGPKKSLLRLKTLAKNLFQLQIACP